MNAINVEKHFHQREDFILMYKVFMKRKGTNVPFVVMNRPQKVVLTAILKLSI